LAPRPRWTSCHELNPWDHPIAGHQLTGIRYPGNTEMRCSHYVVSWELPPILRCTKLQTVTGIQCAML
jgi:hypothetical protein